MYTNTFNQTTDYKMIKSALANQSPMVKLFFLLVLAIGGLSVSLFIASILINSLWGFNYISDPGVLGDFDNPHVVDANRLLIF